MSTGWRKRGAGEQPAVALEQEPVAYDKTEMNCFVQDLYDKKMQEGKHGHYETMFHVVHQAIKKVPPQRDSSDTPRTWVGLTEQEQGAIMEDLNTHGTNLYPFAQAIEAKLKAKNERKEKNNDTK